MASSPVPVKLQPLHNFSFTHLTWKNHRRSRLNAGEAASSSSPPPPPPWREPSSSSLRSHISPSPANTFRRPYSELEPDQTDQTNRRTITESIDNNNNNKRKRSNKISIRLREINSNRNDAVEEHHHSSAPIDDSVPVPAPAEDESSPKIWNLRPRRPPTNQKQPTGSFQKVSETMMNNKQLPEVNISNNNSGMIRRLKKEKFSIPLSRSEIEEDILLLTGSKPSRRPKKRPRAIQKQLDNLFPGLWLDTITADSYKVSEASTKG